MKGLSSVVGRLRLVLLLWLLTSGEVLSVFSGVGLAAGGSPFGGKAKGGGKDAPTKKGGRSGVAAVGEVCDASAQAAGTCINKAVTYRGGFGGGGTAMDLTLIKVVMQLVLTTINVACWLLPLKLKRFTESKVAISLANAFSGGVFLSLAFGHMLPHAQHGFEHSNLPAQLPYYLTLGGYILIFFVEKVAFDTHTMLEVSEDDGKKIEKAIKGSPKGGKNDNKISISGSGSGTSGRSATILLLALSVHSLFETMAMGISKTKLDTSLLAMSIGLHQPAESLALLVSFLKSGLSQGQIIKMLSIFSCVGPLGCALGVLISEVAGELADAILVAIAAGTFIYVGATEVIAEEFEHPENKWKKFFALAGGIVLIGYITTWAEALEGRTG